MAGNGKRRVAESAWVKHVKRYAEAHGCTYGEAMSRASESYHGSRGGAVRHRKGTRKASKRGGASNRRRVTVMRRR